MRTARGFLLICLIGGFSLLFYSLMSIQNPIDEGEGRISLGADEDVAVESLNFSEWKGQEQLWSLNARRANYNHEAKKASFKDAHVTFFPPEGGKMDIWAKDVFLDSVSGDITAIGDVKGKSEEGYYFTTQRLNYYADERIVETEDKVTLEKDRLTLKGVGMKGFLKDHRFNLLSSVRAVFSPQAPVD